MIKPKTARIEYAATTSSAICGPYRDTQISGPTTTITRRTIDKVIILCLRLLLGKINSPLKRRLASDLRVTLFLNNQSLTLHLVSSRVLHPSQSLIVALNFDSCDFCRSFALWSLMWANVVVVNPQATVFYKAERRENVQDLTHWLT